MNVCCTYKTINACINKMLHLLSKVILSSPNSLSNNEDIANNMLNRLGLKYDAIYACKNRCILFRHGYAKMETYPIYHAPRFRQVGMSKVPNKILGHFFLIPCMRIMLSIPHLAALMTWHENKDSNIHNLYNFPQWDHFIAKHPDFEVDNRNIHLGWCRWSKRHS